MAVQKYDIPIPGRPGAFEKRWWSPINAPVLAPDGQVAWIIHRVEDVTAFVLSHSGHRRRTAARSASGARWRRSCTRGRANSSG